MEERETLTTKVGKAINDVYTRSTPRLSIEEMGELLIRILRTQGIYINEARKDPSGRW